MLKPRKVGWLDLCRRDSRDGGGEVGCCLKYTLKGGATEKRGGDTKILKIGGQAGSGMDALKREGAGTTLQTMDNGAKKLKVPPFLIKHTQKVLGIWENNMELTSNFKTTVPKSNRFFSFLFPNFSLEENTS